MDTLEKLVALGSEPIGHACSEQHFLTELGELGSQLEQLLRRKNGFYAFESALHVFASASTDLVEHSLQRWNSPHLWRKSYNMLAAGYYFFAEDAFGNQYGIKDGNVWFFDAEDASAELFSSTIEKWATRLLANYQEHTGWPFLRDWQLTRGPIKHGRRLIAKVPFVLGGNYSVDNFAQIEAVAGMRARANLAVQLHELPDGSSVEFRIDPTPSQE